MPEPPLVSIVTPSYNQGAFIETTIRSVLDQSYPRIEHIVVDGGSTDGTLEILARYPHVKWTSEPDSGQAEAVNKGFKRAAGEIVGWLNSDDLYLEGAVAEAVAYLGEHPHCTLVYGDYVEIDEQGTQTAEHRTRPFDLDAVRKVGNLVSQPAAFFRREVFEQVGYLDTGYRYAMDYDYWFRIGLAGLQLEYVPRFWAAFRYHPESKSVAEIQNFWAEERQITRRYGGPFLSLRVYVHYRDLVYQRMLRSRFGFVARGGRDLIRDRLGIKDPRASRFGLEGTRKSD
jgi:glycosyltransferase involved in cell wall biosynthesis